MLSLVTHVLDLDPSDAIWTLARIIVAPSIRECAGVQCCTYAFASSQFKQRCCDEFDGVFRADMT